MGTITVWTPEPTTIWKLTCTFDYRDMSQHHYDFSNGDIFLIQKDMDKFSSTTVPSRPIQ